MIQFRFLTLILILYPSFLYSKAGMPQFEISTFPSQLFWLLVTFILLYLIMSKKVLPVISETLQTRRNKIVSDLDNAESLKKKSDDIIIEFEKKIKENKEKTALVISDAVKRCELEYTNKINETISELDKNILLAEEKIKNSRIDAQKEIKIAIINLSKELIKKISSVKIEDEEIEKTYVKMNKLN